MKKILIILTVCIILMSMFVTVLDTTEACKKKQEGKKMTVYESCTCDGGIAYPVHCGELFPPTPAYLWGQIFTIGATGPNLNHRLDSIELKVYRTGNPGTIKVYVAEVTDLGTPPYLPGTHPAIGAVIASGSFNGNAVTDNAVGEIVVVQMNKKPMLVANGTYCFYVSLKDYVSPYAGNTITLKGDENTPSHYPGGHVIAAGNPWEYSEQGMSIYFKELGYPTVSWMFMPVILNLRAKL